jgi:hypothetical protein
MNKNNENDAIRAIKTIVKNVINAMKLSDLVFGKVRKLDPLVVRIDQKLELEDDELIISDDIRKSLSVGTTLSLLRQSGGQVFYVLGKGGDPDA